MEWISVDDRMPDDGTPVIVSYISFVEKKACVGAFTYWGGSWYNWNGNANRSVEDFAIHVKVTHWMPMPEPYTDA